jgi:hypothetical protein
VESIPCPGADGCVAKDVHPRQSEPGGADNATGFQGGKVIGKEFEDYLDYLLRKDGHLCRSDFGDFTLGLRYAWALVTALVQEPFKRIRASRTRRSLHANVKLSSPVERSQWLWQGGSKVEWGTIRTGSTPQSEPDD